MQQRNRTRIPKFGSWDSSDGTSSTPFTELFEEARAVRGGGMGSGSSEAEILAGRVRNGQPHKVNPTKHARRGSREDGAEAGAALPPPLPPAQRRQIEPPAYRVIDDSRYVPGGENGPKQIGHSQSAHESGSAGRLYTESLNLQSTSRSPARVNGSRSSASPAWEKVPKPASEGSSTPGRSRLRNSTNNNLEQIDSQSEKAPPALPKFGAWDANDPASADGFTMIFNNARNEKKAGGSSIHVPPIGLVDKDLYPQRSEPKSSTRKLFCCFHGVEA